MRKYTVMKNHFLVSFVEKLSGLKESLNAISWFIMTRHILAVRNVEKDSTGSIASLGMRNVVHQAIQRLGNLTFSKKFWNDSFKLFIFFK